MRHSALVLAAFLGLAAAAPALATETRQPTTSRANDGTAAITNYTGKGDSGDAGAAVDRGPSNDASRRGGATGS
jgi:hypothetical protein